jgi:hypothetical protein
MLDNIKLLLNITDAIQDNLLNLLIEYAVSVLTLYIQTDYLPDQLTFICQELVVRRFNKIASEGHTEENLQGSNVKFELDDLKAYKTLLDKWIDANGNITGARKIKML